MIKALDLAVGKRFVLCTSGRKRKGPELIASDLANDGVCTVFEDDKSREGPKIKLSSNVLLLDP